MINPLFSNALRALATLTIVFAGFAAIVGSGGGGGGGGGGPATLTLVAQPANVSVFDGSTATFTVTANNASGYQWQRFDGANWNNVAGATAASYAFAASLADNNLQVRAVVSGGGASITSNAATLTVLVPASITTSPQSLTVAAGQDAMFSVTAAGATPSYRWQLSTDGGGSWSDAASGSTATLVLTAVTGGDNGKQFRVIVSNGGASVTSGVATLSVFAPVAIAVQPSNQSVLDGATATFSIVANNATGYQWQRFDGANWANVAGATSASYSFTASLAQTGLQVRVVVAGSGNGGNNSATSNAATLTVTAVVVPASITTDPQNTTVASGQNATFTVVAAGSSLNYHWEVSSNGGGSWVNAANGGTATLVVPAASAGDSGKQYRAVVGNTNNAVTSRAATLTVVPPVAIVTQPAGQTVIEGNTATFTVAANNATGYQWQQLNGSTWGNVGGATSASYAFTTSLSQNGLQLRVVVSNSVGSITSNPAVLTVNAAIVPIAITAQPRSDSVFVGNSASFAVTATGTSPTYQWQVNSGGGWTNVASNGNAATYTFPSALETDDGKQFRVIVGNTAGSVTSNPATLTVVVEFVVASGGGACGGGGCGGDSGSGVGGGADGSASAGPGLSAMRNVLVTVTKPNGQVLGTAAIGNDYLVSLYPRAYTGAFVVEFADNGTNNGQYFDESLQQWLSLGSQKLRVMVPALTHHISVNPVTEAAYQYAIKLAGSQAGLNSTSMQAANELMRLQLNAKLPQVYQTNDITNYVPPISNASGPGTLSDTHAGRYGAVLAALPIAGSLYDSSLTAPALAFTRQLTEDMKDDSLFNASATVTTVAYDSAVAAQMNAGLCTAISIWGSAALPSQLGSQAAGPGVAGQLTRLAGSAGGAGNCDGWGSNARFDNPWRVAVDGNGNVYVADRFNKTVRKISPAGAVQTLAGSPGKDGVVDGVGLAARFTSPHSIAVDGNGVVYVGDGSAIRRVSPQGAVTTLAGSALQPGYANGSGSTARLGDPQDLSVDTAGNVYVADSGYFSSGGSSSGSIRKITPAGVVSTVTTDCGANPLDGPTGVAVDSQNNVYIANTNQNEICKLTGSGAGSVLVSSGLQEPRGIAVDGGGNVYVADSFNEVVRKITPAGSMTTLAGGLTTRGNLDAVGSSARFRRPNGVAVDISGNVYVADEENHTIRKITAGGTVTTLAGLGPDFGYADGTGSTAKFYGPSGSVADGQGNLYIVDSYNYVIRKVTPAGVVTTLAGSPGQRGNLDGTGSGALFDFDGTAADTVADRNPTGIAIDASGNLYVTERGNDKVRRITPQGLVTTVASAVGFPTGVAVDSSGSTLYVSVSSGIKRITVSNGVGTLFVNSTSGALALDSAGTTLYVVNTTSAIVQKVSPSGVVSTFAGTAGQRGTADGTGAAARFSAPISIAIDATGTVYVGEVGGFNVYATPDARTVRMITPAGVVTTVVGKPGSSGNILGALPASLGRVSSVSVVGSQQIAITADDGVFLATFP